MRWQHPERGVLSPQQFVPLAEEAGLAGALFDQVLARALDAQLRWGTDLGFTPSVSVNLLRRSSSRTPACQPPWPGP